MKNKLISKILRIIPCILVTGLVLGTSIDAKPLGDKDNKELKAIAEEKIEIYLNGNEKKVISDLNEVSNSEPISVDEYVDSSGNIIKVETRRTVNKEGIEIENIREYITPISLDSSSKASLNTLSINSTTKTIRDKYGLFYAGVAGGDGYLVAEYKYTHPTSAGPSRITTQFHGAKGYIEGNSSYKLNRDDPNWDTNASQSPSASVKLYIQKEGWGFPEINYKNTCTFNSRGAASFSWF